MPNQKLDLRKARLLADLTQRELAEKVSVHPHTIADWEKNPGKVPISKANQIATILETDLYIFL